MLGLGSIQCCVVVLAGLAGCGRMGFDMDPRTSQDDARSQSDGAVDPDGSQALDDAAPDAPLPAATINFISTASSTNNSATYTFNGVDIGTPAANRIVVVCAFLGGGATTQISSITVGGMSLTLTGRVTDGVSGSWAVGYAPMATGSTATIAVTSANAGRAAIAVYNITATSAVPIDSGVQMDPANSAGSISANIDVMQGSVIIANAGYGSNTPSWTWSGSWTGYSINLNTSWAGEQGTYTSTAGAASSSGTLMITATPSSATPKLLHVVAWR